MLQAESVFFAQDALDHHIIRGINEPAETAVDGSLPTHKVDWSKPGSSISCAAGIPVPVLIGRGAWGCRAILMGFARRAVSLQLC